MIAEKFTVQLLPTKYPDIASVAGTAGKLPTPLSCKEMKRIAYQDRTSAGLFTPLEYRLAHLSSTLSESTR